MKRIEEWKDIERFEGKYQVSNLGRVKSLARKIGTSYHHDRILKQSKTKDGYLRVRLLDKKSALDMTQRVHRLVAEAFIPNPDNLETVNHKDGDKTNNNVSNLEWMDRYEQLQHAYLHELKKPSKGSSNSQAKLTDDDVRFIRKTYVKQSKQFGTVALGRKFGVTNRVIGLIVNNKSYKNVK